jgi:hypothetical protein
VTQAATTKTTLVPVTLAEAKRFVDRFHRHNRAPVSWKFGVGLADEAGELVGVAMAGRPVGRGLDLPGNVEIARVCTLGHGNANSRLYGAVLRAAAALGYGRAYTYTLQGESGASLKAVGFVVDAVLDERPTWDTPARRRVQVDLFGEPTRPAGAKVRWRKDLNP